MCGAIKNWQQYKFVPLRCLYICNKNDFFQKFNDPPYGYRGQEVKYLIFLILEYLRIWIMGAQELFTELKDIDFWPRTVFPKLRHISRNKQDFPYCRNWKSKFFFTYFSYGQTPKKRVPRVQVPTLGTLCEGAGRAF